MRAKLFVTFIFTLTIFVPGCEQRGGVSQSTPEDAVRKFADAFLRLNKAGIMASVNGSEVELEALSVFIDYMIAVRDFKKAVVSKYGSKGWTHFENDGGAKLSLDMAADRSMLDSTKIEVRGRRATCTFPDTGKVIHLQKKKNSWYVDASDAFSREGSSLGNFIKTWSSVTNILRNAKKRIGQPDVTAESLDEEVGAELAAVLTANR
jgi:hypothetical protein